jgi:hypothetical protein
MFAAPTERGSCPCLTFPNRWFARRVERTMPFKFEWQFKYRDERFLNAGARQACESRQKPAFMRVFCIFPDFGLPCRLAMP